MIFPFPASLHWKLCPCSAPVFVDHILSLDISNGLPVCRSHFLPAVTPPENLGSHRELSLESGSICAGAKVLSCGAEVSILSSIPWFQVKKKPQKPKPQQQKPNSKELWVFFHYSSWWTLSVHQMTLQLLHSWGHHSPVPQFTWFLSQWGSKINCIFVCSPLFHHQPIMYTVLASTLGWKLFGLFFL